MSFATSRHRQTERQPVSSVRPVHQYSRLRVGQARAPKRSIEENRTHRVRRSQKADCGLKSSHSIELNCATVGNAPSVAGDNAKSASIVVPQKASNDIQDSVQAGELIKGQFSLCDHKRPRSANKVLSKCLSSSAPESSCSNNSSSEEFSLVLKEPVHKFTCISSLLDGDRLSQLLLDEFRYYPNNEFLHYVNPELEDKVDATLRNEAVHNLRFMHNVLFNLPTETFCKAINLIDRFIVKVKVKPKYMACVATAAYCTTSRMECTKEGKVDLPTAETLVQITRCGGNAADLYRMEEILASKLCNDLNGVCAFDFLSLFTGCLVDSTEEEEAEHQADDTSVGGGQHGETDDGHTSLDGERGAHESADLSVKLPGRLNRRGLLSKRGHLVRRVMTRLEIAMCSLEVYRFRPAVLAVSLLAQAGVTGLSELVDACRVNWSDVVDCVHLVDELYELYYRDPMPGCRHQLVWTLSRRTLFRIGYSCPTPLDTISEDYEPADEDEWLLSSLFEPLLTCAMVPVEPSESLQ